MSKKRRKKRAPEGRSARSLAPFLFLVAGILILVWGARALFKTPADTEPGRATMERQVAMSLHQARERARKEPGSSAAWGQLGMVLHAHGLVEEAEKAYAHAIAIDPGAFEWHYLRARALEASRPEDTLREAREAARLDPKDAPAHVVMARVLELQDERDEAVEQYEKALDADPRSVEAIYGLGRLALARGDTEEAIRWLSKAAELAPEVGAIHASLARALLRHGEREAAAAAVARARESEGELELDDPWMRRVENLAQSTLGMHRRAKAALASGDVATAERLYRRLVELKDSDEEVHFNLGLVLTVEGKSREANREFLRALALRPGLAAAHLHAGINFIRLGERDDAERHLREAAALEPENGVTRRWLAELLLSEGDVPGAVEQAKAARRLGVELSRGLEAALRRREQP